MIIPKKYGGLEFSAYAHSEVIRKLSTRSLIAAVTAMVPNSLGPGELLHAVRHRRSSRTTGCRGLPTATRNSLLRAHQRGGGLRCRLDDRQWRGLPRHNGRASEVLGIRLNWHKRYITLGPIATVLGLAFKLYDPDHLIGERDGDRHHARAGADRPARRRDRPPAPAACCWPSRTAPTRATTCSFPMDHMIGGVEQVGKGWKMLMSALAAGRGISLPSLSAGGLRVRRAHHRHVCARARAVPRADRPLRSDPGDARPHGGDRLSARCRAAAYLRRHRSRPQARGRHRDHEGAGDRAHARQHQRRDGRSRRQGHPGRAAELSRQRAIARCRSASRSRAPTS